MRVSLVLPCYNEEANLQKGVLDKIGNFTKNDSGFVEVIISDDGSTDNSSRIIRERYLTQFSKFRLLENKHQGKAFAIMNGIKASRGDYVMFSDFDLATPIEESGKLIKEIENGYPIVIGSRSVKRAGAPFIRKIMALGSVIIRSILIGIPGIRDTQCGFKAFKKDTALKIIDRLEVFKKNKNVKGSSVSAGFDIEFLFLAFKMGYKIKEVPVIWRHVETKNVNFLKDSFESLNDILRIRLNDLSGKYR